MALVIPSFPDGWKEDKEAYLQYLTVVAQRDGLAALKAPVPPSRADGSGGGLQEVSYVEVWNRYYDQYERYIDGCSRNVWFGRTAAGNVRGIDALDDSSVACGLRRGGVCREVGRVQEGHRCGLLSCVCNEEYRGTNSGDVVAEGGSVRLDVAGGNVEQRGNQSHEEVSDVRPVGVDGERVRDVERNKVLVDDSVGESSVVRGRNYSRNQRKRASRKARIERKNAGTDFGVQDDVVTEGAVPWRSARVARVKSNELVRGHFSDLPVDDQRALKESYAKRLRAENELKMFKAQQQLELEKAKDLTQLKKRQETHIMRQTEVNKVQVERAFASLARTGNIPGVVGSVETVVTDGSSSASPVFSGVGSGTISPNSSISLAEIRAIQKDALDKAQEIEKLKRRMNRLLDAMPHLKGHAFADPEAPETVDTGVTVDSNGFPIGEFGDGYDGGIREDGKWHFGQDIY